MKLKKLNGNEVIDFGQFQPAFKAICHRLSE